MPLMMSFVCEFMEFKNRRQGRSADGSRQEQTAGADGRSRRQEAGGRRQEAGGRRPEQTAGGRRQEAGGGRSPTRHFPFEIYDSSFASPRYVIGSSNT